MARGGRDVMLHLYFARRFATTFAATTAIFAALVFLVTLVDQVRRFDGADLSLAGLVGMTLLAMPDLLYTLLPLLTIIATLALFLALARSSELVIARASGRSALVSLAGPLITAIVIGVAAVMIVNPIVATTMARYEQSALRIEGTGASVLSLGADGLWLRQGGAEGQTVIRAEHADAEGTSLRNVTFISFSGAGQPAERIEAATARLVGGAWELTDAKTWPLDAENPERVARMHPVLRVASTLTAGQILESFAAPPEVPIWELPEFIAQMDEAGFAARRHRIWLQMEFSRPLLLGAMVMLGAAFTMRHTRFGRTGMMVLCALALGFFLFFVRNFAQILGENGQLPIALAAWGPPSAAILLPLGLLLHWEDG